MVPLPIARLPSVGASPVHPASRAATIPADSVWRANAPSSSALEDRLERRLEVGQTYPVELLAVDEERGRRVDAKRLGGARADGGDVIEQPLIGETFLEALLGEACLPGKLEQFRPRVTLDEGPIVL